MRKSTRLRGLMGLLLAVVLAMSPAGVLAQELGEQELLEELSAAAAQSEGSVGEETPEVKIPNEEEGVQPEPEQVPEDDLTVVYDDLRPVIGSGSPLVAGGGHSLLLSPDGEVLAWGANGSGQCGTGALSETADIARIEGLADIIAVAAGDEHSLALKSDGTVWAWGSGANGRLGNGSTANRSNPVPVKNLDNVIAIAAGANHSMALREDGTVWSWGLNVHGNLGNGVNTASSVPVQALDLNDVVQIDAGSNFSLALTADGTAWAWGRNNVHQLGDGTVASRSVPAPVANLTGVSQIVAGGDHAMAILPDGSAYAWGRNNYGQLGIGAAGNASVPVAIALSGSVEQLAGGERNGIALLEDGSVHVWGYNDMGQLGNGGSGAFNRSPVRVELPETVAVAWGLNHALALDSEGALWGWGQNDAGQVIPSGAETYLRPALISESGGAEPVVWTVTLLEDHIGPAYIEHHTFEVPDGQSFSFTCERMPDYAIHEVVATPAVGVLTYSPFTQEIALDRVTEDIHITATYDRGFAYRLAYYYEGEDEPFDVVDKIGTFGQTIPSKAERNYQGVPFTYSINGFVRDDSATSVSRDIPSNVARIEFRRLYNFRVEYYKDEITDSMDRGHYLGMIGYYMHLGEEIPVHNNYFSPGPGYNSWGTISGSTIVTENEEENVVYVLYTAFDDPQEYIIGPWRVEKIEYRGTVYSIEQFAELYGMDVQLSFQFHQDGTVSSVMQGWETEGFYVFDGENFSLQFDGGEPVEVSLEGDEFVFYILDYKYYLVKQKK